MKIIKINKNNNSKNIQFLLNNYLFILMIILLPLKIKAQQNFLSFIQPFINNKQQPLFNSDQPQQNNNGIGNIGQFIEMFQNVRSSIGQNGQSNKEQQIQQLANSAQTILSTFSNSGKGETSQTSEYLNFGKSFGLGSALDNKKRKKRQSSQIPNIFNLLEDIAHKSKELRQQRQKQQQNDHQYSPPLNRQYLSRSPQASTSIGRITDNFGKNFFQVGELKG